MFYQDDNSEYILEKDEFPKANDEFENESFLLINYKSLPNEIKINNTIKKLFSFYCQTNELDEINENDIYLIRHEKWEVNNPNNFIHKIKRTDISSHQKVINNNNNHKLRSSLLGRKRNNSDKEGFHTKYFFDNKIRKIKRLVLQEYRSFINKKIKEEYKLNKMLKDFELIKIRPEQVNDSNIIFNRAFIHKSLKEIFSTDTTVKNHCNSDHNKKLIEKLLNEKKDAFENILNLKFLEVLDYLVEKRPELIQLKGLIFPEKLKPKEEKDNEYTKSIRYNMENFENILNQKKPRNKKKKKIKNIY